MVIDTRPLAEGLASQDVLCMQLMTTPTLLLIGLGPLRSRVVKVAFDEVDRVLQVCVPGSKSLPGPNREKKGREVDFDLTGKI